MIIYEINRRFLDEVTARWPKDLERIRKLSLIEEEPRKQVRMANLAICGSHSINGVAELHTRLLQKTVVPEFSEMFPERFNNKTNGVTHRRWLFYCNPGLSKLLMDSIGDAWVRDPMRLKDVERFADDADSKNNSGRSSMATRSGWPRCFLMKPGRRPIPLRCSIFKSSASMSTSASCSA